MVCLFDSDIHPVAVQKLFDGKTQYDCPAFIKAIIEKRDKEAEDTFFGNGMKRTKQIENRCMHSGRILI